MDDRDEAGTSAFHLPDDLRPGQGIADGRHEVVFSFNSVTPDGSQDRKLALEPLKHVGVVIQEPLQPHPGVVADRVLHVPKDFSAKSPAPTRITALEPTSRSGIDFLHFLDQQGPLVQVPSGSALGFDVREHPTDLNLG